MAYLATNEFAGTGAVMQVEINFTGNRPDAASGTTPYFKPADVLAEVVVLATTETVPISAPVTLIRINANTFRTASTIPVGQILRVYRKTEDRYPLVDFKALQLVTELDLDNLTRQAVFMAGEAKDAAGIARADSSTAVMLAVFANRVSNQAVAAANVAINTANFAAANASAAVITANAASNVAGTAASAASAALTSANSAVSTANAANTAATAANGKADSALANSTNAVSAANAATTASGIAVTAANAAGTKADTAATAATQATSAAAAAAAAAQATSDSVDNLEEIINNSDSAASLAINLAATDDAAKGAQLTGWDGVTVGAILDDARSLVDYVALRAYSGRATTITLSATGIAGRFRKLGSVPGAVDDGGVTIIAANGVVWRRVNPYPLSVLWFGATTTGDTTAAFQAAYNSVADGGVIVVPAPGPYIVGALTGNKQVTWEVLFDIQANTGMLALPGTVQCRLAASLTTYKNNGSSTDFSNVRINRVANYSGGTAGQVCSNLFVRTDVTGNATQAFEWAGTFILDNAGQGQNVAVYGQANRKAGSAVTIGGTFAACFEARDTTQEANPTSGLIGAEIDVMTNGGDSNGRRVGLDVVIGKGVTAGTKGEVFAGLRFGPVNSDNNQARFSNCVIMHGEKDYGLVIDGVGVESDIQIASLGGKIGVRVIGTHSDSDFVSEGTTTYGLRLTGTYSSGVAIRMASGNAIAFESTAAITMKWAGSNVQISNAGVAKTSFSTADGSITIGTSKVLGPRDIGWAAMTGTENKGTVYDISTVTLLQLAARVAALQKALTTTHGMIGAS